MFKLWIVFKYWNKYNYKSILILTLDEGETLEKERLVNFIATIMDDSGFNVTKNYKVGNQTIDIYGTFRTNVGEVGVVVTCKNYEEPWKVGLDVIKEMEKAARTLHASKIIIFTTSSYTHGCALYAQKRNIKLVDRKGLIKIAKNYAQKRTIVSEPMVDEGSYDDYNVSHRTPARLNSRSSNRRRLSSRPSFSYSRSKDSLTRGGGNYIKKPSMPSVDVSGMIGFFENYQIVYLIILVVIASAVAYVFNIITAGPYTGLGKILTSAIICFGGLALVDHNMSDLVFKGGIIFFISIIISIVLSTM